MPTACTYLIVASILCARELNNEKCTRIKSAIFLSFIPLPHIVGYIQRVSVCDPVFEHVQNRVFWPPKNVQIRQVKDARVAHTIVYSLVCIYFVLHRIYIDTPKKRVEAHGLGMLLCHTVPTFSCNIGDGDSDGGGV